MFPFQYPVPQTDPLRSPRETLPTMYDLKSEDPEEPGLPDEFHDLQPQLLTLTFRPTHYPASRVFSASDMNLYYVVFSRYSDRTGRTYESVGLRPEQIMVLHFEPVSGDVAA